jgi:cbb3-type cytochrome oxidase subunit 3
MSQLFDPGTDLSWLGSLLTTTFMLTFLAWVWWAYAPSRRAQHEATGRMPLDEEASR